MDQAAVAETTDPQLHVGQPQVQLTQLSIQQPPIRYIRCTDICIIQYVCNTYHIYIYICYVL